MDHVERVGARGVKVVDELGKVGLERLQVGQHREQALAQRHLAVAERLVRRLEVVAREHRIAFLGRAHLQHVIGAVETLQRNLHRDGADLLVGEKSEERVDHEVARDGGRVGAVGHQLGAQLGHRLAKGLLSLHQAELDGRQGELLVPPAGELGELAHDVELRRELAQRLHAEALGEGEELPEEREAERRAQLKLLVRKGSLVDVVERVWVGLEEGGDGLVGGGAGEGGLDVEEAAEQRADDDDGVLAQAGRVLGEHRLGGRERRAQPVALHLVLALNVVVDQGVELRHELGDLLGVFTVEVLVEHLAHSGLQLLVELGRQLVAEGGEGGGDVAGDEADGGEGAEQRLHLRLRLDHVAVHHELQRLLGRAELLERAGRAGARLGVIELALELVNLLHL
mmetsp:Transcript_39286/g.86358  ORF Transcript_39286/g.86358 Transcript_39286/m.86358 type:complete len:398 (+) Transcript_39286:2130-3323(+)